MRQAITHELNVNSTAARIPSRRLPNDMEFYQLVRYAHSRTDITPLNRSMTTLLGISTGTEVIETKQIGVISGDEVHGLIVSIKSNTDDVILVNRGKYEMNVFLTDSTCRLRTAATLNRSTGQPKLISTELAHPGFDNELRIWKVIAGTSSV
jgi:hypothetical protein